MSEEKQVLRKKDDGGLFSFEGERYQKGLQMAEMLCKSDLVPASYKNNVPNTMIALSMAGRLEMDPMTVMQNLHIIKGKPSWSSSFIIACINSCGRFSPLNFVFEGEEKTDDFGCRAVAMDVKTNKMCKGTLVTWKMVKSEGWFSKKDKNGRETSKWQTMPELMFQYRAAAFFGRVFCPDLLHGMHSNEEVVDITARPVSSLEYLLSLFDEKKDNLSEDELVRATEIINDQEESRYPKLIKLLKSL